MIAVIGGHADVDVRAVRRAVGDRLAHAQNGMPVDAGLVDRDLITVDAELRAEIHVRSRGITEQPVGVLAGVGIGGQTAPIGRLEGDLFSVDVDGVDIAVVGSGHVHCDEVAVGGTGAGADGAVIPGGSGQNVPFGGGGSHDFHLRSRRESPCGDHKGERLFSPRVGGGGVLRPADLVADEDGGNGVPVDGGQKDFVVGGRVRPNVLRRADHVVSGGEGNVVQVAVGDVVVPICRRQTYGHVPFEIRGEIGIGRLVEVYGNGRPVDGYGSDAFSVVGSDDEGRRVVIVAGKRGGGVEFSALDVESARRQRIVDKDHFIPDPLEREADVFVLVDVVDVQAVVLALYGGIDGDEGPPVDGVAGDVIPGVGTGDQNRIPAERQRGIGDADAAVADRLARDGVRHVVETERDVIVVGDPNADIDRSDPSVADDGSIVEVFFRDGEVVVKRRDHLGVICRRIVEFDVDGIAVLDGFYEDRHEIGVGGLTIEIGHAVVGRLAVDVIVLVVNIGEIHAEINAVYFVRVELESVVRVGVRVVQYAVDTDGGEELFDRRRRVSHHPQIHVRPVGIEIGSGIGVLLISVEQIGHVYRTALSRRNGERIGHGGVGHDDRRVRLDVFEDERRFAHAGRPYRPVDAQTVDADIADIVGRIGAVYVDGRAVVVVDVQEDFLVVVGRAVIRNVPAVILVAVGHRDGLPNGGERRENGVVRRLLYRVREGVDPRTVIERNAVAAVVPQRGDEFVSLHRVYDQFVGVIFGDLVLAEDVHRPGERFPVAVDLVFIDDEFRRARPVEVHP